MNAIFFCWSTAIGECKKFAANIALYREVVLELRKLGPINLMENVLMMSLTGQHDHAILNQDEAAYGIGQILLETAAELQRVRSVIDDGPL